MMRRAAVAFALLLAACTPAPAKPPSADAAPAAFPAGETAAEEPKATDIGDRGGMCGGIAGFQCKSDADYCAMAPGSCVEIADAAGVCTEKPAFCTEDYRPVCGCDGATYPNACAAAAAGVNVAAEGECRPPQ